jgi:hypothetical protein
MGRAIFPDTLQQRHTSAPRFDRVGVADSRTIGAGPRGVKQEMLKDRFRNIEGKLHSESPSVVSLSHLTPANRGACAWTFTNSSCF